MLYDRLINEKNVIALIVLYINTYYGEIRTQVYIYFATRLCNIMVRLVFNLNSYTYILTVKPTKIFSFSPMLCLFFIYWKRVLRMR